MSDLPVIDADLDPDTPNGNERWTITDPTGAAWAVRKRGSAETRIDEQETIARSFLDRLDAERAEITQWLARVTADDRRTVERMEHFLTDWLHQLVEDDPDVRTVPLPGADLIYRKGRERYTVLDADAFAEVLELHGFTELVTTTRRADLNNVKAAVKTGRIVVGDDGELRDSASGFPLPGVLREFGDDTYSVTTTKAGEL